MNQPHLLGSASGSPGPGPEREIVPPPHAGTEPSSPNACETRPPPPHGKAAGPALADLEAEGAGAARPARAPRPTLQVIESTHDLILWAVPAIGKFPRHLRFTLGERIEQRLYALLESLIQARFASGPKKVEHLRQANVDIEIARHGVRLAWRLRVLSLKQLEHFARLTDEVGRQVGAWMKSATAVR